MSTLGERERERVRLAAPATPATPDEPAPREQASPRRVDGEIVPLRSLVAVPIVAVVT